MKVLSGIRGSLGSGGWALLGVVALAVVAAGIAGAPNAPAHAGGTLEERKLPMRFSWVDCQPNCRGWISAVGVITAETPQLFETFARDRSLQGATVVLDSGGGSVNDAIALGRRWRKLGLSTMVGMTVDASSRDGVSRPRIVPEAYCESMCVFLMLAGTQRYLPPGAHLRVHQIWMGDRADDPRAATYSAQDLMIVERDIGRLAKYTFDMGGTGDLLALALSVPPWEDLHEMTAAEIRAGNLVTTDAIATVLPPPDGVATSVAELNARDHGVRIGKPVQDRVASDTPASAAAEPIPVSPRSTRTAEAGAASGAVSATTAPAH